MKDKVAIVTGAARGLGRAYAVHLASHGARVCVGTTFEPRDPPEELLVEMAVSAAVD